MAWLKRLFGLDRSSPATSPTKQSQGPTGAETAQGQPEPNAPRDLSAVPGALAASYGGQVVYNMLTPHMQQFLGRCVGAVKKAGLRAKGTGQFSIIINESAEVHLTEFYRPTDDPATVQAVVEAAKRAAEQA